MIIDAIDDTTGKPTKATPAWCRTRPATMRTATFDPAD